MTDIKDAAAPHLDQSGSRRISGGQLTNKS